MATESWALDGVSLTSGNFAMLQINADPPRARADWITAADSESAALFRQPFEENRTITMKLRVTPQASMNAALDQVGAVVDKLRKASATTAGVPLVWTPGNSSRSATFTVLLGEITGLPIALDGDGYSWVLQRPIIEIELACQPYWYGTETLTSVTTSATPFAAMEITGVTGDVEALGRLIITDNATQSRRHVEWGLEGPLTYNASTSLLVDSDDMVTSGFSGAQTTSTGAYDPNASGNSVVALTLVAGTTTAICGTGNLSHVGVFRVKARVKAGSLSNEYRLSWKALDGPMNHNAWVSPVSVADWIELDLGTITVTAATVGTQRWTGQIEVMAASSSPGTAVVDYLVLVPAADGYGKARGVYSYSTGILAASDDFTTASAALDTRVAPLGGTWVSTGDATDWSYIAAGSSSTGSAVVSRLSNTGTNGRFGILGSTSYTDVEVNADVWLFSGVTSGTENLGVIARWTDSSNYLKAFIEVTTGPSPYAATLYLRQLVAGVATDAATVAFTPSQGVSGSLTCHLRLIAFASGRAIAQAFSSSGALLAQTEMSTSALATAGTLATGKPGIWDFPNTTSGRVRYYDNFSTSVPSSEPIAIYSGKTMQVRYDDTIRDDSTGTYTGRPQSYRGSRFLVPVGTSRVLAKVRRNDIDTATDPNVTDSTKIQVGWTPRGLAVPR